MRRTSITFTWRPNVRHSGYVLDYATAGGSRASSSRALTGLAQPPSQSTQLFMRFGRGDFHAASWIRNGTVTGGQIKHPTDTTVAIWHG